MAKVFGVMILIKSPHEGAEAPVTEHPLDVTETHQTSRDEVTVHKMQITH